MEGGLKPCTKCGLPIADDSLACPKYEAIGHGQLKTNSDSSQTLFTMLGLLGLDSLFNDGAAFNAIINGLRGILSIF